MRQVAGILGGNRPVLFDFDGPICSIFAGSPAPAIAHNLRSLVARLGVIRDDSPSDGRDPLEVLRWSARSGNSVIIPVENALVAAEIDAVRSAEPTPFAHDVLRALHHQGRIIGIASNNSTQAIERYLLLHGLTDVVDGIAGRRPYAPERMKPDPHCLQVAARRLGVDLTTCVYVGDSISDIQAARAVGIAVIAYANKPGKSERFRMARANVVIQTMDDLRTLIS